VNTAARGSTTTGRLAVIDALRGWAALAVVLFHLRFGLESFPSASVPAFLKPVWLLLSFGNVGVWLFFVISGFCIHLRWAQARAAGEQPRIGFGAFWRRRIRRLYPPYLVALLAYLAVVIADGNVPLDRRFGLSLGLHVLMLQNLTPWTLNTFNSVFWTLAIEEQLYLAYFALLWLRRRFSWPLVLACCFGMRLSWFALGFVLHRVTGGELLITQEAAAQWFIWALGAVAVEAAFGLITLPQWCSRGWIAVSLLAATGTLVYFDRFADAYGWFHKTAWIAAEPLWGVAFFVCVNALVRKEAQWRRRATTPAIVRYSAAIGLFSYSLYLTHQLIISHVWVWLGAASPHAFADAVIVVFPATVAFAWVFFRLLERPFMARERRSLPRHARAAAGA
jgi:peptidoglycan/LPS O-acetylase OafA/YrhL